jgi:D-alanine-D-alanine ligase
MPFPLIVKPSREDASVGISSDSVVHDVEALTRRVAHVVSHYR